MDKTIAEEDMEGLENYVPEYVHKKINSSFQLKDSGNREVYESGAQRDNGIGKGRFDLLGTQMLFRLARHYEAGARKYSDRNFEKGMNISRCVDAAMRHLVKYLAGWQDEDHLAAVVWNCAAIMFYEHEKPEFQDLPKWKDRKSKWVVEEFLD